MDEEIYHQADIVSCLRRLNPHLELKESFKNIGEFTLDLVLHLADQETRVQIPMDTFRNYSDEDRRALERHLEAGYERLLRMIH